jgi:hypothetical protein
LLKGLVEGSNAIAFSKKAMEKEFKQFAEKVKQNNVQTGNSWFKLSTFNEALKYIQT